MKDATDRGTCAICIVCGNDDQQRFEDVRTGDKLSRERLLGFRCIVCNNMIWVGET